MKIETMFVHFARPDMFVLVLLIVAIAVVVSCYRLRKTTRIAQYLDSSKKKMHLLHYSFIKKLLSFLLWCVAIVCLATVIMRPQWHEVEASVTREGRDVLIALDISRSMLAQDFKPDRLTYAKEKIKELVKRLKTDRVGLILFSGSTFMQCPLTDDFGAFAMFLDAIDVETISSGTTAIDGAIKEAIAVFEHMPERKNKLLVIFTDGEDFSSNLASIKKKAASIGLHIVTVGVGTAEGAPIPLYDKKNKHMGHQLDTKKNVVISRMNEGILQRIAEDTGGIFVPISKDTSDIQKIQQFVTSFEKELLNDKQLKQYQEQYQWLLLISFIALAIEWLL